MPDPTIDSNENFGGNRMAGARAAASRDWGSWMALIVSTLLSAAFSLVSVGRLAQRAEQLVATNQAITVGNLATALHPLDAVLGTFVLASVGVLVGLEWSRRAFSRLLHELTPVSANIILATLVGWLGHTYWFPGVLLGGDSGSHIARFLEVRQSLEAGQFPVWTNYDYLGSPLLTFTGPLTYLVGGGLDLILKNPVLTAKVLLFSLHLASAFAFYALLQRFGVRRISALVATIGFSGSFAHLHLFLYRGVFPQAFTILFLVLLFYSAEGLMRRQRLSSTDWLLFATATAGLIVNHQPHALFSAFYLGLFGSASLLVGRWQRSGLLALVTAGFSGVAASAFAILPILWEGDWVMIQPDNGFFEFRLPTATRISHLLLWHVTRENWGTDYWAYLGVGLLALAALGLCVSFLGSIDSESRKLVFAIMPCLTFLPFLYNPVVRDIIFVLFFVAILAAIGGEFLAKIGMNPRLILAIVILVFTDVASTSIQPVARTDKQFLIDAGRFLQTAAPNERFMELDFSSEQDASPDIGPGAGPISEFTMVQRIAGTHNMAATRVHNFAEATVERVGSDLINSNSLSRDDLTLLSLFNVTRVICMRSFDPGCPISIETGTQVPELGQYISIADASPVLFSQHLVALSASTWLDKPMVWSEDFRPETSQVRAIQGFLDEYLFRAGIEPHQRIATTLPVRHLPKEPVDISPSPGWDPGLVSYSVEEQRVSLTIRTNQSGYVQIAHPWYPGTKIFDNGYQIFPLEGSLDLMVIPLAPGEHLIELIPAMTPIESISLGISSAAVLAIFMVFGLIRLDEHRRCTAEPR